MWSRKVPKNSYFQPNFGMILEFCRQCSQLLNDFQSPKMTHKLRISPQMVRKDIWSQENARKSRTDRAENHEKTVIF